MQELCIMTGAVELMVVDYQCIMPAVTTTAKCFHTKVISTFDKAKFPGAEHISFDPVHGLETGRQIVRMAIENYSNRVPERVTIPVESVPMMAGFSVEAIVGALGGTPEPPRLDVLPLQRRSLFTSTRPMASRWRITAT